MIIHTGRDIVLTVVCICESGSMPFPVEGWVPLVPSPFQGRVYVCLGVGGYVQGVPTPSPPHPHPPNRHGTWDTTGYGQ